MQDAVVYSQFVLNFKPVCVVEKKYCTQALLMFCALIYITLKSCLLLYCFLVLFPVRKC